jgi:hypothetical protein
MDQSSKPTRINAQEQPEVQVLLDMHKKLQTLACGFFRAMSLHAFSPIAYVAIHTTRVLECTAVPRTGSSKGQGGSHQRHMCGYGWPWAWANPWTNGRTPKILAVRWHFSAGCWLAGCPRQLGHLVHDTTAMACQASTHSRKQTFRRGAATPSAPMNSMTRTC